MGPRGEWAARCPKGEGCVTILLEDPKRIACLLLTTNQENEVSEEDKSNLSKMSKIIEVSPDLLYNIRAPFPVFKIFDFGSQSTLCRLSDGNYILADTVIYQPDVKARIDEITENGTKLFAIINLHPFHTKAIPDVKQMYPNAKLYGVERHVTLYPNLQWEKERVESTEFRELPWVKQDFELSVPRGLYLEVPGSNTVHASSVLMFHKPSRTLLVDDTFGYLSQVPWLAKLFGYRNDHFYIHPTVTQALLPSATSGAEFMAWAEQIANEWPIENVCAAHNGVLLKNQNQGKPSVHDRIIDRVNAWKPNLEAHDRKYAVTRG